MDRFSFMAICFYYYTSELFKYIFYVAGISALLFMIHKLVFWVLWVMRL